MSSSGKKRKHAEKMKRKKAAKAAKAAKYKALAGTSKKTKRQRPKTKLAGNLKNAHVMLNCGNVGCERCFPNLNQMGNQYSTV